MIARVAAITLALALAAGAARAGPERAAKDTETAPLLRDGFDVYRERMAAAAERSGPVGDALTAIINSVGNRFGARSPEMVEAHVLAAVEHYRRDEFAAAATRARATVALSRDVHGDRSPHTAMMLATLADVLGKVDHDAADERRAALNEALAIRREALGDDHVETVATEYKIALLDLAANPEEQDRARLPMIAATLERAIARLSEVPEPNEFELANRWSDLAIARTRLGKLRSAEAALEQAKQHDPVPALMAELARAAGGDGAPPAEPAMSDSRRLATAEWLRAKGRVAEAEALTPAR